MKKTLLLSSALALLSANVSAAEGHAHWGYTGHTSPEHWAELNPDFAACGNGKNQSPVDLSTEVEVEASLQPIEFHYALDAKNIVNNGHAVQINFNTGSYMVVDGKQFNLLQVHFHNPSENHIDHREFPMEAHFVHSDKDGNLAVVAVMYEEGQPNQAIEQAWKQIPMKEGEEHALADKIDLNALLPQNHDYYRFNGSLTTPPCTEGVRWLVMKQSSTVSKGEVETFAKAMHVHNNRPVQPMNARLIMK